MMIKLKNVLMNSGSTFCARILGTHLSKKNNSGSTFVILVDF